MVLYETDRDLLRGFQNREEEALAAADRIYGARLRAVAKAITGSAEDAEECASDALLGAWNAIPPAAPENLLYYLVRAARNAAYNKLRQAKSAKRRGELLPLDELEELLPGGEDPAARLEQKELTAAVDRFLSSLPKEKRAIFLRRYFYGQSTREIAAACGIGESKVRTTLCRLRKALREELERSELIS